MRRFTDSIVSFVSWHRRAVAALLAALGVLLFGHALGTDPPRVPTIVVTGFVAAGERLQADDLAIRQVLPESLPEGAIAELESVLGKPAAVSLPPGTVLQTSLISSASAPGPGRALVPISVRDDGLRQLLQPGDLVSLVSAGAEAAEVICADARVAAAPSPEPGGTAVALAAAQQADLVLVDVPADHAAVVAALGQNGQLSLVIGHL